jgi:hypothetical protein
MNDEKDILESIEQNVELPEAPLSINIGSYFKGFYIGWTKRSLDLEAGDKIGGIKSFIEKLIEEGFEPSWNKQTSKEQLKSASEEFVESISADPTPICGIHNARMVWKTGVSKKTNKPYAFWGCDQRMPDGGFCTFKPIMPETK